MSILDKIDKLLEEDQVISEEKREQLDQLEEVQREIENGEASDDPIKDFMIYQYGLKQPHHIEDRLRALSQEIDQHQGQQFLVIKEWEKK